MFGAGFADDSDASLAAAIVGLILWVLCVAVVALLYAPTMMARTNGKTLGRMVTGIRVVRATGEPITFGFAMLREVGGEDDPVRYRRHVHQQASPPSSTTCGRCGTRRTAALHDFIVNTRVVKD